MRFIRLGTLKVYEKNFYFKALLTYYNKILDHIISKSKYWIEEFFLVIQRGMTKKSYLSSDYIYLSTFNIIFSNFLKRDNGYFSFYYSRVNPYRLFPYVVQKALNAITRSNMIGIILLFVQISAHILLQIYKFIL